MEDGIRFAETSEELHAAFQLRYQTYVSSLGLFKNSCDHTRQILTDAYDENARIVVVIKNSKIIGTLRVIWGKETSFDKHLTNAYQITPFLNINIDPAKICIVERLVVDKNHRGSAAMLRMFNLVMNFILSQQIELILINAENQNVNSYIKLGYIPFTKQFIYPDVGPVTPMAFVLDNHQHLQRIGSPFSLLMSPNDTSYCQHTKVLLDIIQREANFVTKPSLKKIVPALPAANHSFYAKKSPQLNIRLRQRLAMA